MFMHDSKALMHESQTSGSLEPAVATEVKIVRVIRMLRSIVGTLKTCIVATLGACVC